MFGTAEVVEYCCNLAPDLMGEYVEGVSPGMDTYSIKQPLGVCTSIHMSCHMPSATSNSTHTSSIAAACFIKTHKLQPGGQGIQLVSCCTH